MHPGISRKSLQENRPMFEIWGFHLIVVLSHLRICCVNSLRPRLNRRPFADDIFKCIFLNENEWISPRISLKFVPKVRINHIPALVQIMAWRRSGGKPLSEPMMVSLLTHICVTRPQWVNSQITPVQLIHGRPRVRNIPALVVNWRVRLMNCFCTLREMLSNFAWW